MYAVILTGGKQYKVAPGDIVRVEKLGAAAGERVEIKDVLLVKDQDSVRVGTPTVAGTVVKATVLRDGKDRKVFIFKKKPRKQYRRTRGHRQEFTEIRVDEIAVGS